MAVHPRAGTPARPEDLIDISTLLDAYADIHPDPRDPAQRVTFGTSGHRGSALDGAFNDDHIAAITQAICDYRRGAQITGPVYLGRDSHALSEPAQRTAVEVLAANSVTTLVDTRLTPTPAISLAILEHNARGGDLADGIVVTPSHNPPRDGGIKYNPPDGGPAGSEITAWIGGRANDYLADGLRGVRRTSRVQEHTRAFDYVCTYVDQLPRVIDIEAIRSARVRIGADPLGGASIDYWRAIAERYGLDITVVNPDIDPAFGFMTVDWDGRIRMDCSSPYAMASLISRRSDYDIATGNDADADRHGIVTPDAGLLNPNHFLSVAINYLCTHRDWPAQAAVGKTLVSSAMIDRVTHGVGRTLMEVPVGFKWFVAGLRDGSVGFGGEESAGASFLRRDGSVWTTDKDGILLALLAAEILAVTGSSPAAEYAQLVGRYGDPAYARIDAPATRSQKDRLARLSPGDVAARDVAGQPITEILTVAPGNGAPIGGVKVTTADAWFAARPSGTEDVYKIYAESFLGPDHLARVQDAARYVVDTALTD